MKNADGQAGWAWAVANWADIGAAKTHSPFLDRVFGASVWSSCSLSGLPALTEENMVREGNRALLPQQRGEQWLPKLFAAIGLVNPLTLTWADFTLIEADCGVGDGFKAAQQSWSLRSEVTRHDGTLLWCGCVLSTGISRSNTARQEHMTALLAEAQKEALGHQRKLRRTGTDSVPRLEEIAQKLVGPPECPKMLATFLMRTPRRSDFFGWCRSGQECTLHLGSVDSTTVTAKSTEDVAKMAPDPDADEPAALALVRRSVAAGVASAWSAWEPEQRCLLPARKFVAEEVIVQGTSSARCWVPAQEVTGKCVCTISLASIYRQDAVYMLVGDPKMDLWTHIRLVGKEEDANVRLVTQAVGGEMKPVMGESFIEWRAVKTLEPFAEELAWCPLAKIERVSGPATLTPRSVSAARQEQQCAPAPSPEPHAAAPSAGTVIADTPEVALKQETKVEADAGTAGDGVAQQKGRVDEATRGEMTPELLAQHGMKLNEPKTPKAPMWYYVAEPGPQIWVVLAEPGTSVPACVVHTADGGGLGEANPEDDKDITPPLKM